MSKAKILLQFDTDAHPSAFDSIVAIDGGVDNLLTYHGITPHNVTELVHGAIFTRSPDDLWRTAIFVGGSDVAAAEAVLEQIRHTFFGPLRVSVMLDPGGANTTAAAAVLAALRHVPPKGATATVLGGTGPVGQRCARLLAREGATVRVCSRSIGRAEAVCSGLKSRDVDAQVSAHSTRTPQETRAALEGSQIVIAAGAAGVELLDEATRRECTDLKVAIDLNAVPPAGIAGIEVVDRAAERDGLIYYGAIGVGNTKMRIHKNALQLLFEMNDRIMDAEELFELGRGV
jgi:predicted dinucleotide-binding enzyme